MKLKKIVSLALAGILAVSMLTACGDNGSSSSSSSEPVVNTTDYVIASKINNGLDSDTAKRVSFTDSANLQDVVKSYFQENELTATDYNSYSTRTAMAWSGPLCVDVATQIQDKLGVDKQGFTTSAIADDSKYDADADDMSVVEVHFLKSTLTEDAVAKLVADYVNDLKLPKEDDKQQSAAAGNAVVDYKYTGNVSLTKVETEGKTESMWVVAIVIDKDVVAK